MMFQIYSAYIRNGFIKLVDIVEELKKMVKNGQ
jgi:hypothetical protein